MARKKLRVYNASPLIKQFLSYKKVKNKYNNSIYQLDHLFPTADINILDLCVQYTLYNPKIHTPHNVCKNGHHLILEYLLENDIVIDFKGLLLVAIKFGHFNILTVLFRHCPTKIKYNFLRNEWPLVLAIKKNSRNIIHVLLSWGASFKTKPTYGTALWWIIRRDNFDLLHQIHKIRNIDKFLVIEVANKMKSTNILEKIDSLR